MCGNQDEIYTLIKKQKIEMEANFKKHHQNMLDRFRMVEKEGRKTIRYSVVDSLNRLNARFKRYTINSATGFNEHSIRNYDVVAVDRKFKIMTSMIPLVDVYREEPYRLHAVVTNMVISNHAVARWLMRNKSNDIVKALAILGNSIAHCDQALSQLAIEKKMVSVGFTERQLKCLDGGMSVAVITNPEEGRYDKTEWSLVTYISSDMVKDWNLQKMECEFENLDNIEVWR